MTGSLVLSEPGPVWRLILHRPEARNAISSALIDQLISGLDHAAADDACRVVVLTGAGQDFCAGADVGELMTARDGAGQAAYARAFEAALARIESHPRPVIAAVQGAALGAGCQIVLGCDLVVAAEDARFGIPSGRLGIVLHHEGVERLVLSVGPKRAAELLLAGRSLTGVEAVEWGLAHAAVEPQAVGSASAELAERVAALAPLSVAASKVGIRSVINSLAGRPHEEFVQMASKALASEDLVEGLTAFRERRRPDFRGR